MDTELKKILEKLAIGSTVMEAALKVILIIAVGIVASHVGIRIVKKILLKSMVMMSERKRKTLTSIVCSALRYTIYFMVIFNVLTTLGVNPTSIVAVVSVFSVAIGLGAQNFVKDIITGFLIIMEDQFGVGDYVAIDTRSGSVEVMGLRTTSIRSIDGYLHIIPNNEIRVVTNMSKRFLRVVLDVVVPYTVDTEKVLTILKDEMKMQKELFEQLLEEPVVLGITKMGGPTMEIRIVADCQVGTKEEMERALRLAIKERLAKENIC